MNDLRTHDSNNQESDVRIEAAFAELSARRSSETDVAAAFGRVQQQQPSTARRAWPAVGIGLLSAAAIVLVLFGLFRGNEQVVQIDGPQSDGTVPTISTGSPTEIVEAINSAYADGDYVAAFELLDDEAMLSITRAASSLDLRRLAVPDYRASIDGQLAVQFEAPIYLDAYMQEAASFDALALDLSGDLNVLEVGEEYEGEFVTLVDVVTEISTVEGTTRFTLSQFMEPQPTDSDSPITWRVRAVEQNDAESETGFPLVADPAARPQVDLPDPDRATYVYEPAASSRFGQLDLSSAETAAATFAERMASREYSAAALTFSPSVRADLFNDLSKLQADRLVRPGVAWPQKLSEAGVGVTNHRVFPRFLAQFEPAQHRINFSGNLAVTGVEDGESRAGDPAVLVSATLSSEPGELVFVMVPGALDRWYMEEVRLNGGEASDWFFNAAFWLEDGQKLCPTNELIDVDATCSDRELSGEFGVFPTPERAIEDWLDGAIDYAGACQTGDAFNENQWCTRGSTDAPTPDGALYEYVLTNAGDELGFAILLLQERGIDEWRVVGDRNADVLQYDEDGNEYDLSSDEVPEGLYLSILDYFTGDDSPVPTVEGWCFDMGVGPNGAVFKSGRCIRPHAEFPNVPEGTYRVWVSSDGEKRERVNFHRNGDFWELGSKE